MQTRLSISTNDVLLLVVIAELLWTAESESFDTMTSPPKHRGVFYKQQSGFNKTIPFSESPGEEVVVFDVDGTLWPFQIDTDPRFKDPFTIKSFDNGTVFVGDHTIEMFPEVEATLLELIEKGYLLAAVSLTNSTYKTMAVLNAFDLTKHFKYMEMAPGPDKLSLITAFQEKSGIHFEYMLFLMYKYSRSEIHALLDLGVSTLPIGVSGISLELLADALFIFRTRKQAEDISDDELPSTTESRVNRKLRLKQEKLKRRNDKKEHKLLNS